ncbi:hypothetical protein MF672_031585 [Actinomadura sp. ATCC 31491]|uniref:Uncharacterized protein n=1 Tax=Actinomadura luzonensis TaxID=2805427 RepID=A0ABT0G112_9ACTN|nr:hypothetical protein [Actinomadura luzonensis]MCK2218300.1 hypothetical protein [Actinomadura luzonensis]
MRHLLAALAALPLALPLTLLPAPAAHAATGEFFFETGAGRMLRLFNPPSGRCIRLPDASPAVANHTDRTVSLWMSDHCTDPLFNLPAGESWRRTERVYVRSVTFA